MQRKIIMFYYYISNCLSHSKKPAYEEKKDTWSLTVPKGISLRTDLTA